MQQNDGNEWGCYCPLNHSITSAACSLLVPCCAKSNASTDRAGKSDMKCCLWKGWVCPWGTIRLAGVMTGIWKLCSKSTQTKGSGGRKNRQNWNTTVCPTLCLSQAQAGYSCISSIKNANKWCNEENVLEIKLKCPFLFQSVNICWLYFEDKHQ